MQNINSISGQLFRLQLSTRLIAHLVDKGFMDFDDEQFDEATYSLARLLKDGLELDDYSYEFTVFDKQTRKSYIA